MKNAIAHLNMAADTAERSIKHWDEQIVEATRLAKQAKAERKLRKAVLAECLAAIAKLERSRA